MGANRLSPAFFLCFKSVRQIICLTTPQLHALICLCSSHRLLWGEHRGRSTNASYSCPSTHDAFGDRWENSHMFLQRGSSPQVFAHSHLWGDIRSSCGNLGLPTTSSPCSNVHPEQALLNTRCVFWDFSSVISSSLTKTLISHLHIKYFTLQVPKFIHTEAGMWTPEPCNRK